MIENRPQFSMDESVHRGNPNRIVYTTTSWVSISKLQGLEIPPYPFGHYISNMAQVDDWKLDNRQDKTKKKKKRVSYYARCV